MSRMPAAPSSCPARACHPANRSSAYVLPAVWLIVAIVAPLTERFQIFGAAIFWHVVQMRDRQHDTHDAHRSDVIAATPGVGSFLRPFQAQGFFAEWPRLVPYANRRPASQLTIWNSAELAAVASPLANISLMAGQSFGYRAGSPVKSASDNHCVCAVRGASIPLRTVMPIMPYSGGEMEWWDG